MRKGCPNCVNLPDEYTFALSESDLGHVFCLRVVSGVPRLIRMVPDSHHTCQHDKPDGVAFCRDCVGGTQYFAEDGVATFDDVCKDIIAGREKNSGK